MEPLFSVITVTWNAAGVLPPTLRSVAEQTWRDYEYLVVDGASTDATLDLVRHDAPAGTRLVSEPDRGLYDAMNKGLTLARGRYVMFLNAGDSFAAPDVLARLAAIADGNAGVLYGQTVLVDADRHVVGPRHLTAPPTLTARSFRHGMVVCHQAFAARRDLAPPYDLQYRFSADYDWCLRILEQSPANAYAGDAPLIHYLTDGLTDQHRRDSLRERYRIMCRHYGTLPTLLRHAGFAVRYALRRLRGGR